MNNSAAPQKLQRFLSEKRNQRALLVSLVVSILILCFLSFLSSYAIVQLVSTDPTNTSSSPVSVYAYQASTESRTDVKKVFGNLIVPRSSESLVVIAGKAESIVPVAGKLPFGYSIIDIELRVPSASAKISIGGDLCPIINDTGVYSHACATPSSFKKYTAATSGAPNHSKTIGFKSLYVSSQYKDGILAWSNEPQQSGVKSATISYVAPEKDSSSILNLPDSLKRSSSYIMIIPDSQISLQNTGFVLYEYDTGTGYYYDDFTAASSPKIIKRQRAIDAGREASSCVLNGGMFICYHGNPGEDSHNIDENLPVGKNPQKLRKGVVEITDLSLQEASTKTYTSINDTGITDLYATLDGTLFGRYGFSLERITLDDESFKTSPISTNMQIASAGAEMYYVQNSKLYAYNTKSGVSSLYYYDKDEDITKLVSRGDKLFSLSYNIKDPLQLLNVYEIALESN